MKSWRGVDCVKPLGPQDLRMSPVLISSWFSGVIGQLQAAWCHGAAGTQGPHACFFPGVRAELMSHIARGTLQCPSSTMLHSWDPRAGGAHQWARLRFLVLTFWYATEGREKQSLGCARDRNVFLWQSELWWFIIGASVDLKQFFCTFLNPCSAHPADNQVTGKDSSEKRRC